jgi:hypothetical protein
LLHRISSQSLFYLTVHICRPIFRFVEERLVATNFGMSLQYSLVKCTPAHFTHCASTGCGWRRRLPHVRVRCYNTGGHGGATKGGPRRFGIVTYETLTITEIVRILWNDLGHVRRIRKPILAILWVICVINASEFLVKEIANLYRTNVSEKRRWGSDAKGSPIIGTGMFWY